MRCPIASAPSISVGLEALPRARQISDANVAMNIDALTIANEEQLACDICIVGGGVTGMLLAERLSSLPIDVIILESGNDIPATAETSDLLSVESSGSDLEPTPGNRARAVGGTPNIWNTFLGNRPAARFFRMEAVDFERRDGLPFGGWPFSVDELAPYYDEAERRLMPGFTSGRQRDLEQSHRLGLDPAIATTVAEGFGYAATFTRELPERFATMPRVTLVSNATVTEIETDASGTSATRVLASPTPGRRFTIAFRTLVLAAGTIENIRLLLVSNRVRPAGIGNGHDQVGRFLMDHQRLNAGRLVPFDRSLFDRTAFFDLRAVEGQYWMGKIKLSQDLIRQRQLLNSSTLLWPRPSKTDDGGVDALKELARLLRKGRLGAETRARLREVLAARQYLLSTGPALARRQRTLAPNISRGGWSHLRNNHRRFEYFELVQQIEQAPDPNNRITLGGGTDRFGGRLPRVHARFCAVDLESARLSQELLNAELARAGVGTVVRDETAPFPDLHQTGGIYHTLGGTRAHIDPKQGVVDGNACVHDMTNLYITGGSVFTTGGYANPTLTMAALALRLGHRLEAEYKRTLSSAARLQAIAS